MLSGAKRMQAGLRMRKNDTQIQIGKVQIGNVQIGNVYIGNVQIGNVQIGNVCIGNVKIVNTEIGRMEWPFSATVASSYLSSSVEYL